MVNGKVVTAVVISALILLGTYFFVSVGTVQESGNTVKVIGSGGSVRENPYLIEITSQGFFPEIVTISVGETITFVNKDSEVHWPATDVHPTHTVYPGSDIKTCFSGTEEEKSNLFDSCKELEEGESWSFTFTEAGEWDYHDHRNANLKGTVIVE